MHALAGGADRFVVVDTETTGVYPTDRVVEVALVTVSLTGEVIDVFDTLVQPGRDVSASHIHGITASMVRSAPTFGDIAGDIAVRLDGACMVAHNLPFDFRMIANEFAHLNTSLTMVTGIDTLKATGCRLDEACAGYSIRLTGAHRAVNDAMATAQLFLRVADHCAAGGPVAAPTGLLRSGRVQRRDDVTPVPIPDPPLIVYLASRLAFANVESSMLGYLELLGRAMSDLHLDRAERDHLRSFAADYGLTDAHVAMSHRRFLNELIDAAVEDDVVTDEEHDMLVRAAAALEIDQRTVDQRVRGYRAAASGVTLARGMTIVFTGDHPRFGRDELAGRATALGLVVQPGVNKSTNLVAAADPESSSGKAEKARRYGIPIVAADDIVTAQLGDTLTGYGAGQAGLKVITCPDCLATRSVPATSAERTSQRCSECAPLQPTGSPARAPKVERDMWAPPTVEWLICQACSNTWHREVVRGRKPHQCPNCAAQRVAAT